MTHEATVMDWDGKFFTVPFDGNGKMPGDEDRLAPRAHRATRTKAVRNGRPLSTFSLMAIDGQRVSDRNAYS